MGNPYLEFLSEMEMDITRLLEQIKSEKDKLEKKFQKEGRIEDKNE